MKDAAFASRRGGPGSVAAHLGKGNVWSVGDAELYVEAAFETWACPQRHRWTLDISVLETRYGLAAASPE